MIRYKLYFIITIIDDITVTAAIIIIICITVVHQPVALDILTI